MKTTIARPGTAQRIRGRRFGRYMALFLLWVATLSILMLAALSVAVGGTRGLAGAAVTAVMGILLALWVGWRIRLMECRPELTVALSERRVNMIRGGQSVDIIPRAEVGLIVVYIDVHAGRMFVTGFVVYSVDRFPIGVWCSNWEPAGVSRALRGLAASGYPWATKTTRGEHTRQRVSPNAPRWAADVLAGRVAVATPECPAVSKEPYTVALEAPIASTAGEVRFARRGRWATVSPTSIESDHAIMGHHLHVQVEGSNVSLVEVSEVTPRLTFLDISTCDGKDAFISVPAGVTRVCRALRRAGYLAVRDGSIYDGRFMNQPPGGPLRRRPGTVDELPLSSLWYVLLGSPVPPWRNAKRSGDPVTGLPDAAVDHGAKESSPR